MTERPVGDAVKPELSELGLARQWQAIRQRIRPPRRQRWPLFAAMAATAAVAAAAVVFVYTTTLPPEDSAWDGAIVESAAEPVTVTLKDGSRIDLQRQSRLELVERNPHVVQFRLRTGSARFDVQPAAARRFSVVAEDVVVRVVGTRFSVSLEPVGDSKRVSVSVDEGTVEVEGAESTIRLSAGEAWSTVGKETEEAARDRAADQAAAPTEPASPDEPDDTRAGDGPDTPAPASQPKTARELFEAANRARLEGNPGQAADKYRTLLAMYPGDARAGLAAFELGRLLQDRLGDPSGAARALGRAVSLASGAGFREDAMARRVRAYATLGAAEACEQAKTAYLRNYPDGVHATAVDRACPR